MSWFSKSTSEPPPKLGNPDSTAEFYYRGNTWAQTQSDEAGTRFSFSTPNNRASTRLFEVTLLKLEKKYAFREKRFKTADRNIAILEPCDGYVSRAALKLALTYEELIKTCEEAAVDSTITRKAREEAVKLSRARNTHNLKTWEEKIGEGDDQEAKNQTAAVERFLASTDQPISHATREGLYKVLRHLRSERNGGREK